MTDIVDPARLGPLLGSCGEGRAIGAVAAQNRDTGRGCIGPSRGRVPLWRWAVEIEDEWYIREINGKSLYCRTMKIFLNILVAAGFALALIITTKTFVIPHQEYQADPSLFLYDHGNASPSVRAEILEQLEHFQDGYDKRDTLILESYMEQLFSKENILILGTMPGEIYSGYSEAADLVSSDWLKWGDVHMLVESSNISASDSVAWFSMIGHVVFDISSWLDLPLRVSGVMVREDLGWKFQQLQFQFDLNTKWVLNVTILLAILLIVSIIRLLFLIVRTASRQSSQAQ